MEELKNKLTGIIGNLTENETRTVLNEAEKHLLEIRSKLNR